MTRTHELGGRDASRVALSREARAVSEGAWRLYQKHPFFAAIADGSLSFAQLRFWLEHDLPYVRDFESVRRRIVSAVAGDSRYGDFHAEIARTDWVDVPGQD